MPKTKFINDKYKKSRGGYSRLLNISCAKCSKHICYYQKDGPGILKRMYLDRIYKSNKYSGSQDIASKNLSNLICPGCKELIGVPMIYKKESRPAFRLFEGSVAKKISNSNSI